MHAGAAKLVPDRVFSGKVGSAAWLPSCCRVPTTLAHFGAAYDLFAMAGTMTAPSALLPAATDIGTVTLRVADADRSLAWYRDMMGLELIDRTSDRLSLGAGGKAFLFLDVHPGTPPRVEETTGLYHVAIRVPDRASLGGVLARIASAGVRLGASDHLVSEALYIWDPDNNGLEIYRDRPREEWVWQNGRVQMATEPLDRRSVATDGIDAGKHLEPMPAGTKIGHVHLQVGDLAQAHDFYTGILGFEPTSARSGALFVSAGGYHHHLGLNVWHSLNAPLPAPDAAGLVEFDIVVPDRDALDTVRQRLTAAGYETSGDRETFLVLDPWQIPIRLRTKT
jgi:catechol 2,3-dioxygenase